MITTCWFYYFYWKEIKTVFQRNVCTFMFIDAFLTIDTIGKQPKGSLMLERIKKRLDTCTQWNTIWPQKRRISCYWRQHGWTSRTPKWNKSEKYKHWMISHMQPIWKCQFFSSCSSIQSISKRLEHIFDLSCQWKQIFI